MMPYTEKQRRLFNAAAHDPKIRREHDISDKTATELADEANKLKKEGREKRAAIDLTPVFGSARGTT